MLWSMVPLTVAFAMSRYVCFTYLEHFGPQISYLSVGEQVAIYSDTGQPIRIATADDAEVSLDVGTKAVVTHESAWDQDSCYSMREIDVIVDGGPYRGRRVAVTREYLRPLRWGCRRGP